MYLKGFNLSVNKTPFLYYQGQLTQSLSLFFIQQKQAQKAKRYLDLAHKIQRDSKNEAMIPINLLISGSYFELIGKFAPIYPIIPVLVSTNCVMFAFKKFVLPILG